MNKFSIIIFTLLLISGCTPSLAEREVIVKCSESWGDVDISIVDGFATIATKGKVRLKSVSSEVNNEVITFTGVTKDSTISVRIPDITGDGIVTLNEKMKNRDDRLFNLNCSISSR